MPGKVSQKGAIRVFTALALVTVVLVMTTVPTISSTQALGESSMVNVDITQGAATKTTDAYAPNPVRVDVGDTIIWTNRDSTLHTAIAGTASGGPTGLFGGTSDGPSLIAPSRTQSFTFTEAGEFPYYCILHPTMVGTVIVGDGREGDGNHLTVKTDRTIYELGDLVTISGRVSDIQEDLPVILRITDDKEGVFVRIDPVTVGSDGRYRYQFPTGGALFGPGKSYTVIALYAGANASTTFLIGNNTSGGEMSCQDLAPTLSGTDGNDLLNGTNAPDVIAGLAGDDIIRGFGGEDVICGGPGEDRISGGWGNDRVFGGRGSDFLFGNAGDDKLWGGTGYDRMFGGNGDDVMFGGKGRDSLKSGEGEDQLNGQEGDDILDGILEHDNPELEFEISIEVEDHYEPGDDVEIFGNVDDPEVGFDEVTVTITYPDGNDEGDEVELDSNGEFTFEHTIKDDAEDGVYTVQVSYRDDSAFSYFLVDEEEDILFLETDQSVYVPHDMVRIFGEATDPSAEEEQVRITVLGPDGRHIVDSEIADGDADAFEYSFGLDSLQGRYTVFAVGNDGKGFLTFEVLAGGGQGSFNILVETDSIEYEPGNEVDITGMIDDAEEDEDVVITIYEPGGGTYSADTPIEDGDGEFSTTYEIPELADDGIYTVEVEYDGDSLFSYFLVDEEDDGIEVEIDSGTYEPGDSVEIIGIVEDLQSGEDEVEISVEGPHGDTIEDETVDLDNDEFSFEFDLEDDAVPGRYAVKVVYDGDESGWLIFEVEEGGSSNGGIGDDQITVQLDKYSYRPGDEVVIAGSIDEADVELGEEASLEVIDPNGASVESDSVDPANDGFFKFEFALDDDAVLGKYEVVLSYSGLHDRTLTFDVYAKTGESQTSFDLHKPINISDNPTHSKYHDILVHDQDVYVAWMDGDDTIPQYDIYFKVSHDGGETFDPSVKLSNGSGTNLSPLLAASGSDVYVAWLHEGNGENNARFIASHDYGNSFDPLMHFGEAATWYARLDMAAYDNNVYLVFEHPANPGTEMLFQASHDRGVTFGEPFIYREGPCVGGEPHVSAWQNYVYISAQDPCKNHPDLLFRASHDNGTSFSKPLYLGDDSQQVSLLAKDSFVYLTWNENTQDVRFRVSSDHGNTFDPATDLEGDDARIANPIPHMAIAGDSDVYVVWESNLFSNPIGNSSNTAGMDDNDDDDDIKTHLFFIASDDNGQTFGPLKRLDTNLDYSIDAKVTGEGDNVYVVWQNMSSVWTPSGSEIMMKRSDNKGMSFGDTIVIDNDTGDPFGFSRLHVSARGDSVYISWWDNGETLDEPPDIIMQKGLVTSLST